MKKAKKPLTKTIVFNIICDAETKTTKFKKIIKPTGNDFHSEHKKLKG